MMSWRPGEARIVIVGGLKAHHALVAQSLRHAIDQTAVDRGPLGP